MRKNPRNGDFAGKIGRAAPRWTLGKVRKTGSGVRLESAWSRTTLDARVASLLAGLSETFHFVGIEHQGASPELFRPQQGLSAALLRATHLANPAHGAAEDLGRFAAGNQRSSRFFEQSDHPSKSTDTVSVGQTFPCLPILYTLYTTYDPIFRTDGVGFRLLYSCTIGHPREVRHAAS